LGGRICDDGTKAGGAADRIIGTPAVSNGYVYVPVISGANGWIDVFQITGTPDIAATAELNYVERFRLNGPVAASPAIANQSLYAYSYGTAANPAKAYKFDLSAYMTSERYGFPYWTQFKFNASKTGENTATEEDDDWTAGSSGCFISTIK